MTGDYVDRLRAMLDSNPDRFLSTEEGDLLSALDELEQLRAERANLGGAEYQWRIVTPNGPVHSFTQRDLDDRANWLPGVRLEQRTVYGTPWEPADPQQAEAVEIGECKPDSHCPWCGTVVRLDLDGLVPSHEHPTYFDECPGTHRRPSVKGVEKTPWSDHGEGWKSRRPTLSDFQGPFTGLLGSLGTGDAGEPS